MEARQTLIDLLRQYQNDFLTVARFAEFHGLTKDEGELLLTLARMVESHPHPEA